MLAPTLLQPLLASLSRTLTPADPLPEVEAEFSPPPPSHSSDPSSATASPQPPSAPLPRTSHQKSMQPEEPAHRAWENLTEAEQFAILYPDRVAAGATSHHANHHHAAREGNILCNSPPPRCDPGVKQLPHPHLSRRTPAKTLCTVNAHTGRSATTIRVHQRPSARYLRSPLSTPAHHTEKPHAT